MKSKIALYAVVFMSGLMIAQYAHSQDKGDSRKERLMAEAKREEEAATPGPAHKQLMQYAGEYVTQGSLETKPGEKPVSWPGVARFTSVLGGRFLMEETLGPVSTEPPTGIKFYGYNNGTKQYEANWMWTQSSAMLSMTGRSSDGGKSVTYDASYGDENGKTKRMEIKMAFTDADHFAITIKSKGSPADEVVTMTTQYTRKK